MLRLASYDIVFQEIPGEVTLALNLSNCPNRCSGCHSPHLWEDVGVVLDEPVLSGLLDKYGNAITCVCFMGGDSAPREVERLAGFLREKRGRQLKTGWYSGKQELPENYTPSNFDYIKLGPYIKRLGGLTSATTNQRFYRVENGNLADLTHLFRKQR